MVADGLTKLGTAEVLQMVRDAMKGEFPAINLQPMPTVSAAHLTSVTPGNPYFFEAMDSSAIETSRGPEHSCG